MAWVNLFNLFEEDKNFYGTLNGALDLPASILITEFAKSHLREGATELVSKFNGKPLREIIRSALSIPEWALNPEGKLVNYAMFEVDGTPKFENILEIDILDWLATLPDKQLRAIADCAFTSWRHEKDGNIDYPICHPEWKTDDLWKQKIRSVKAQEKFFSNIEKRRILVNA